MRRVKSYVQVTRFLIGICVNWRRSRGEINWFIVRFMSFDLRFACVFLCLYFELRVLLHHYFDVKMSLKSTSHIGSPVILHKEKKQTFYT